MVIQQMSTNVNFSSNQSYAINQSELVPVYVLGITSILGCFLNMTAASAYCRKDKVFQNSGNVFTVSLIVGDLLFCGVSIPLLIGLETLESVSPSTWKQAFYIATRALLFLNCISSAIGNALLAFDRFDLTQRPSNRYLKRKRTIFVVSVGWLVAVLSLLSPLLSSTLPLKFVYNKSFILQEQNHSWKLATVEELNDNNSELGKSESDEFVCFGTCFKALARFIYPYSSSQVVIQLIFYIFATLTLTMIYGQIYYALHKRTYKYENPKHSASVSASNFNFKSFLKRTFGCIRTTEESIDMQNVAMGSNGTSVSNQTCATLDNTEPRQLQEEPVHSQSTTNETMRFRKNDTEERLQFSRADARAYDSTAACDKTDFASVAFSVKAFVTLKKAVRERRKMKQRKLRQFRRMSIAIIVAYGLCWLPFQIFSLATFSIAPQRMKLVCKLENCSNSFSVFGKEMVLSNDTDHNQATETNTAFLWCLVFASLSAITDALLYSFSRENIRIELKKSYQQMTQSKTLDLPAKRDRSKSQRIKSTEFISLNALKKGKHYKSLEKIDHNPETPSWSVNKFNNWKQIPKIVPLKDPDLMPINPNDRIFSRKHSILSILSSNKSTLETSFASSKSTCNGLD